MKVAIYERISTEGQDATNQDNALKEYCLKKDYTIHKIYLDRSSGAKDSRPAFDEMFRDAHQMKFDLVLFWALDRFSRSGTLFTLQKLKELTKLEIKWHSYQEPFFSSMGDWGDVVISIMATLGKIERQRISERTKAGLKKAVNVGKRGPDKKPRKRRGYFQPKKKKGVSELPSEKGQENSKKNL